MNKNHHPLRVGIIGAGLNGAWGGRAHIPALKALPEYVVTAVGASRQSSAEASAAHFGIRHAFSDPFELALHPEVDLVTVSVRVPEHDRLIRAALEAGKHVYSEFPLGRTTAESATLLKAARERGVRHFAGLQSRANPVIGYVRELLAEGYVGDVLAVHVNYAVPTYPIRSKQIDQGHVYLLDDANGANQLTIAGGHLLDGIMYLFGPFSEISAILKTQAQHVPVEETGEIIRASAPDHVVISGILPGQAVFSSQIRNVHAGSFAIEINGTKGDLHIRSRQNFMYQIDDLTVLGTQGSGELRELTVPEHILLPPAELMGTSAYNVAGIYQQIHRDLANDTHEAPDFQTALAVHELLDQVRKAGETGATLRLEPGYAV
ncbi:putative dehydrogenase [Paenibacillus rhizosphaerae]|uniref:Putative dehydrogenase n=1 Tax=Paenibacillus rhizosphaerae TaxID=297318 RepID=A0A839TNI8_9BACL|nr:Gfo/Idh/MocA family oxidoreductase [Paenibacillus rhizosphaerae]MBB3126988.1 putative dehydrogenase [Paenibacillus rhizosphaerae]